jgi:hypothetical protein
MNTQSTIERSDSAGPQLLRAAPDRPREPLADLRPWRAPVLTRMGIQRTRNGSGGDLDATTSFTR